MKLAPDDQGYLAGGILADHEHGVVKLLWPKPVTWVAMYPDQARAMAASLIEMAEKIEAGRPTKPPAPSGN